MLKLLGKLLKYRSASHSDHVLRFDEKNEFKDWTDEQLAEHFRFAMSDAMITSAVLQNRGYRVETQYYPARDHNSKLIFLPDVYSGLRVAITKHHTTGI